MKYQVDAFGKDAVLSQLAMAIDSTKMALNIQMSTPQVAVLAEDLYEVYSLESLEDVLECLRKGRQGKYGFGHNSRYSLNMILIREWMIEQLSIKATEREKRHTLLVNENSEPLEKIDYNAYRIKKMEEKKKKAKKNVVVSPYKNSTHIENQNDIFQAIQAKLYQDTPLEDEEKEFIRYHKLIIKNKVLYQRL